MSILKINDLQAAQSEGYISELSETEMTVSGGSLISTDDINVLNHALNGNNTQVQGIGGQLQNSPVDVDVFGFLGL
jgi:hypothetical protein